MKITLSSLSSPLGAMLLATDGEGRVRALDFAERHSRLQRNLRMHIGDYEMVEGEAPKAIVDAFKLYFDGDGAALGAIEVVTGGTHEQERAWAVLRKIPAGETMTYGELGKAMGIHDWRAAVDAGAAVGANPVALIVPCHRVISSNGDLKGYAWGLHRKQWLLEHEGALPKAQAEPQAQLEI
jgi:methylated-DNA-[protein]-cysteine S-methyltransferase